MRNLQIGVRLSDAAQWIKQAVKKSDELGAGR